MPKSISNIDVWEEGEANYAWGRMLKFAGDVFN
jgi:hypothetical protein